ncbi:MAG: hypothetical protein ACRC9N_10000 [Aeromonas sp.]
MKPRIEKKLKKKAAQLAAIQASQAAEPAAQLGDVAAYECDQRALTTKREQQLGWLIAMMVILVLTGAAI